MYYANLFKQYKGDIKKTWHNLNEIEVPIINRPTWILNN